MLFRLDDNNPGFPDPHLGEPDGMLAIGGDITPEWLLPAYCQGIFPWFDFRRRKLPVWYCPMTRFVIRPEEIHVSHSMRNLINKGELTVTLGRDFNGVIEGCSRMRIDMPGAWLGPKMVEAYKELHRRGAAVSVEVWEEGKLVGGLYGVTPGRVFCGESMFSLRPSASKLALIGLSRFLSDRGDRHFLIDCQFETPHLLSMGGRTMPYDEYMTYMTP